jgi:hypothetical protein
MVDEAARNVFGDRLGIGEENTIYIPDGYNKKTGKTIDFANAILDGIKKGETRSHKSLTRKWVGIAKDGKVIGRVRFGDPQVLRKGTAEYADSLIEGTEYDIADGETKYYYPVVEVMDLRDNPRPILRNGNYGQYQFKSNAPVTYDDDGNVIPLSQRFNPESDDIRHKLPVGTSSRVALVDALERLARRDEEKRLLNTYRTYIKNAQADQERLVKTRKEIARLRKEGDPNKRIPKLQQAVKTIQDRLDRNDSALLELEGMEILKGIMERAVREQRQMGEAQRRQMSEQYRADRADAVALQKATDADLHAMEQEFLRLMREYEKQGAKRSQLEGALAGIREVSQAAPGEKTFADPLCAAIDAADCEDTDMVVVLGKAAEAALAAAEATREMPAKYGRAKNLPSKGIGFLDPGAVSFACFLNEISRCYKEGIS